jgi:hypothetical protein
MDTIIANGFTVNNELIVQLNEFQIKEGPDLRGTMPAIKSLALKYAAEMARLVNYPAEQNKLRTQVAVGKGNMFPDVFKMFEVAVATSEDAAKILKASEPAARVYPPSAALVKLEEMQGSLRGYFADLFGTMRAQSLAIASLCQEVKTLQQAKATPPAPKKRVRGPKAHEQAITIA